MRVIGKKEIDSPPPPIKKKLKRKGFFFLLIFKKKTRGSGNGSGNSSSICVMTEKGNKREIDRGGGWRRPEGENIHLPFINDRLHVRVCARLVVLKIAQIICSSDIYSPDMLRLVDRHFRPRNKKKSWVAIFLSLSLSLSLFKWHPHTINDRDPVCSSNKNKTLFSSFSSSKLFSNGKRKKSLALQLQSTRRVSCSNSKT